MNKLITVREKEQRSKHTHTHGGGGGRGRVKERERKRSSLKTECKMWLNSTFLTYTRSTFSGNIFQEKELGFAVKQSGLRVKIQLRDCVISDMFLYLSDV